MKIRLNLVLGACATAALAGTACANLLWINEFHYDNVGTDTGEFVEVVIAPGGPAAATVNITLYNGANGLSYNSLNLASATLGSLVNGYQFYVWSLPTNGIQNGSPDGIALDVSGVLDEFISYEGTFAGVGGPANGITSVDIGVSQNGTEPIGSSLGLTGTGADQTDFTWAAFSSPPASGATPGNPNVGQTLVPAPSALALLGIAGIVGGRRRRR